MSVSLLREYVTLTLEKIRTKKGQKGIMGDKFDLKRFQSLPDQRSMLAYANKFLEKLGQGSSRAAFLLSGKYVLKIALNEKGLAQNNAELDVFTNPKSQPIVAKVYRADEDNRWIISDLVRPLTDPDEFAKLTGTDWDDFAKTIKDHLSKKGTKTIPPDGFTQTVINNAKTNKMLVGDIEEIGHWGKTPDNRCVLLDYGFTEDVFSQHYKTPTLPQAKSAPSGDKTVVPGKGSDTDKKGVSPYAKTVQDIGHDKTVLVPGTQDAKTAKVKKNPVANEPRTAAPQKKAAGGDTKRVPYKPGDDDEKTGR